MAAHIRLARWAEDHPHTSNAVFMTMGLVLTVFLFLIALNDPFSWWSTLACAVPLYFRRAAPVATAYALGALAVVSLLAFNVATIALCIWAVPCVMYTVAMRAATGARRSVLVAALIGSAVFGFTSRDWFLGVLGEYTTPQWIAVGTMFAFIAAAFVMVSFLMGDLARERRRRREQLEDRARRLQIEREQEVRLAAQDERARIAREMHDVVAHSLSVVIAQADGARYAAASDPKVATETLGTIADTARGSLTEMRKLLGVLRTEDGTGTAPIPQLGQIGHLVESVRGAGLPVEYQVSGEARLSTGAELTLYRVVQEALTNVLKHAWQASSVRIVIEHRPEFSWVEITNNGVKGACRAPGAGQGLQGLRERVSLYGGRLTAGPHPDRQDVFMVRATLPTEER